MLALNKSIQIAEIPAYTQFSKVEYLQFEVIFVLFVEKSSTKQEFGNYINVPI